VLLVANLYPEIVHPMPASSRRWLPPIFYAQFRNVTLLLFETCFTVRMGALCPASYGDVDQLNIGYGCGA